VSKEWVVAAVTCPPTCYPPAVAYGRELVPADPKFDAVAAARRLLAAFQAGESWDGAKKSDMF